jgi:hypothetical protein
LKLKKTSVTRLLVIVRTLDNYYSTTDLRRTNELYIIRCGIADRKRF